MRVIAVDSETFTFRPGRMSPPLVCVSYQEYGHDAELRHWTDCKLLIQNWLIDDNILLVGHNFAYDAAVFMEEFPEHIPLWFQKYEKDLVTDTMLRQELLDIAVGGHRKFGGYSLADLYRRHAGRVLAKPALRYEYGTLREVPLSEWSNEQRTYALDDARATLAVAVSQGSSRALLGNQYAQARAYLALHLCGAWGYRTDERTINQLEAVTHVARRDSERPLREAGLIRGDGTKNVEAVRAFVEKTAREQGFNLRETPKGATQISVDVFKELDSPIAKAMVNWAKAGAILNREIPLLRSGQTWPIHTRFGLAESGRTTSSPNSQNFSRDSGSRNCIVPRPGYVFAQADYDQFELRGLAQICYEWFGVSKLGELLTSGVCPHLWFACQLRGWDYEWAAAERELGNVDVKETRQIAKVALFGFPGGMGAAKFVKHAKKYGVIIDETRSATLKQQWRTAFPEMRLYLAGIEKFKGTDEFYHVEQLYSGRRRGSMGFNDACNTWFQGLCADAAKHAVWLVQKACYAEPSSVLYGCRMINFIHDEIVLEVPDNSYSSDCAIELSRLMVAGAGRFIDRVPVLTGPRLMRRIIKDAPAVYDKDGKLIPYDYEKT